jgi:phosphatidylglycerol---prolipoprotein diacylglyceryl transferase
VYSCWTFFLKTAIINGYNLRANQASSYKEKGRLQLIIDNISPILFTIGPLTIRWYGVMMAITFLFSSYFILKNGKERNISEDQLLNALIAVVIGLILGARLLYVIVNFSYYAQHPAQILRIDQGGLAFHGGLIGGLGIFALLHKRLQIPFREGIDLAVPGISIGIMLVRIANIFNQEILGRTTSFFPFPRHPAQIYGSLIGLTLLIIFFHLKRKKPYYPGSLFWSFVLYYSIFRGFIEETFREMPLIIWGYINPYFGFGFFTAVQVFTPALIAVSWLMLRKIHREGPAPDDMSKLSTYETNQIEENPL